MIKILVINGSPKGNYSITIQTVNYLQKKYQNCEFQVINAGQTIKALEKDFSKVTEAIKWCDVIIFSYPVYTFIAPSQLHRFIELLKKQDINLTEKYVTQLTTSKHFYDVTAHKYIQENCHDMGMKFITGLSADMDDLLTKEGQIQAEKFMDYVLYCVENDLYERSYTGPSTVTGEKVTVPKEQVDKADKDVVIITDCEEDNWQLSNMIARFQAKLGYKSRVVNILEYPFQGGCLGCFNCAVSGKCIYKDGFDDFLRNEIQTAQSIIYAFTIKDHSMGALFKMYDDRQFCNGHRTVTMGMPMGYLVSGDYSREENLRMIIEGRAQVGGNYLAGVATDEFNPDEEIDRLVANLTFALENKYVPPQNFYGVGGMKIFRDLIWLMQGMMKADHKFYKEHNQYDFPQKKRMTMIKMYLVGALISSPKIKAKMGNAMNEGMIAPYKKVLDEIKD